MGLDHLDIVPKVEPLDDETPYYTLKVDMASEDSDSVSAGEDVDEHHTIDLSTKPRECQEVSTTVCCNVAVNNKTINNNNIIGNNNNSDGEKIVKGSAKRKKPNPMQIVLAKKSKIQEENVDIDNGDHPAAGIVEDSSENKEETKTATTTVITEVEPVTILRKNSIKSSDVKSELEKLEESISEEILRSVLTDESDGDDMISEAFVKRKGVSKKTKKGRKDRKNGGNKKEMTGKKYRIVFIIIIILLG